MSEMACAHCGITRERATGEVNRAIKAGRPLYCSKECNVAAKTTGRKSKGWHERRFEERPGVVHSSCVECGRSMWLPASKVGEYKRCGAECQRRSRCNAKSARARNCATCGAQFTPRTTQIEHGRGNYCSRRCIPAYHLTDPSMLAFAQKRRREAQSAGLIKWKTGPDHHSWKGGPEAAKRRLVDSGKSAALLRRYRAANKDRVREWAQRRKNSKIGKLPYGTVPALGRLQKWKCAICRIGVRDSYHVDHIMPLALGGKHEPRNLQLLCGPCNVRKSARDPIAHMQSLGRLL